MKTFLTHYFEATSKSSKAPFAGPRIKAESWSDAQALAEKNGVILGGRFSGELSE